MDSIYRNAVLLKDDSVGVATENKPRILQAKNGQNGFYCSLNPDWLEQINMAEEGEPTLHSVTVGVKPVIVQNPAIIVQPKAVIKGDSK